MDDLLQQGITAYKVGKQDEARKIFIAIVKRSPDSELAWSWMYEVSSDEKERIYCLQQMLRINPNNEKANILLNQLIKFQLPLESTTNAIPTNDIQNQVPSLKKCPYCAETIQAPAIVCRFCGRDLRTGVVNAAPNLPLAQIPKPKKWYMDSSVKILTFLFITPLWTLIVLEDPDSTLGVKIVAGVLLVVYILFVCPSILGLVNVF